MSAIDRIREDVRDGFPVSNADAAELIEERDEMESKFIAARSRNRSREETIVILGRQLELAQGRTRFLARELEYQINGAAA